MKEEILKWGIPNITEFENRDVGISFDNNEVIGMLPEDKIKLHYGEYDVKFALYDKDTKEIIFIMDIVIPNPNTRIYKALPTKIAKIGLLVVKSPNLRRKGITTYYIKKFQQFCMDNNYEGIKIEPMPNALEFNGLDKTDTYSTKKALKEFYNKLSLEEMPFIFIEHEEDLD